MNIHQSYQRLCNVLFFILFASFPFSKFLISISVVGLLLLGGYTLLKGDFLRDQKVIRSYLPLMAVYLILIISLSHSQNIDTGLQELLIQNGLLTIPIIALLHWSVLRVRLHLFLSVLVLSTICASVITLLFFILPVDDARTIVQNLVFLQEYPEVINKTQFGLYSPFIDRLHFAYIIGFSLLYSIYMLLDQGGRWHLCASALLLVTTMLLGARGAQVALLFAFLPFLMYVLKSKFFRSSRLLEIKSLLVVVVFLFGVPCVIYLTVPAIQKRYDQMHWELALIAKDEYKKFEYQHFTTLTRLKSFQNSWKVIAKNPIFGVGIGDVKSELAVIYKRHSPDIPIHNQNYLLYVWMAGGVFALFAFLVFIGQWLSQMLVHANLLISAFGLSYGIFVFVILMIDVVMKYHTGVFSIPLFMICISILAVKEN